VFASAEAGVRTAVLIAIPSNPASVRNTNFMARSWRLGDVHLFRYIRCLGLLLGRSGRLVMKNAVTFLREIPLVVADEKCRLESLFRGYHTRYEG
jgi:hypothetical protein